MDSDSKQIHGKQPLFTHSAMKSPYLQHAHNNSILRNQPYQFAKHNRFSTQNTSRITKAISDSVATSQNSAKHSKTLAEFNSDLRTVSASLRITPAVIHSPVAPRKTKRSPLKRPPTIRKLRDFQTTLAQSSASNSPLLSNFERRTFTSSPRDLQDVAASYSPKPPAIPQRQVNRHRSVSILKPLAPVATMIPSQPRTVRSQSTQPISTNLQPSASSDPATNFPKRSLLTTRTLHIELPPEDSGLVTQLATAYRIPANKLTQLTDKLKNCSNILNDQQEVILRKLQTQLKNEFCNFQPKTQGCDLGFIATRIRDHKTCYIKLYINRQAKASTELNGVDGLQTDQETLCTFQTYSHILGTQSQQGLMPDLEIKTINDTPLSIVASEHIENHLVSATGAITPDLNTRQRFNQLDPADKTSAYTALLQIMYATLATGVHDVRTANIQNNSIIDLVSPMEHRANKLFNSLPTGTDTEIDQEIDDYLYILNQEYLSKVNPQASAQIDELRKNTNHVATIIKRFIYINSMPMEHLNDAIHQLSVRELATQLRTPHTTSNSDLFNIEAQRISPIWGSQELIQHCDFTEMLKLLDNQPDLVNRSLSNTHAQLAKNVSTFTPHNTDDLKLQLLQQAEIINTQNRLAVLEPLTRGTQTCTIPVQNSASNYTLSKVVTHRELN